LNFTVLGLAIVFTFFRPGIPPNADDKGKAGLMPPIDCGEFNAGLKDPVGSTVASFTGDCNGARDFTTVGVIDFRPGIGATTVSG
jgi:hypothetical protein